MKCILLYMRKILRYWVMVHCLSTMSCMSWLLIQLFSILFSFFRFTVTLTWTILAILGRLIMRCHYWIEKEGMLSIDSRRMMRVNLWMMSDLASAILNQVVLGGCVWRFSLSWISILQTTVLLKVHWNRRVIHLGTELFNWLESNFLGRFHSRLNSHRFFFFILIIILRWWWLGTILHEIRYPACTLAGTISSTLHGLCRI